MLIRPVIYQFIKSGIVTVCDYIMTMQLNKKISLPSFEEVICFLQPRWLNLQAVKHPLLQKRLNITVKYAQVTVNVLFD